MKRKYNVNDEFFENIDSEIKAYLLGFFLADGTYNLGARCTNSYKFSVKLQIDDIKIVELFRDFIVPSKQIVTTKERIDKNGSHHKATAVIDWTSTKMAEDLKKYHIFPRKTYDLDFRFPFELISDEFIWDFIRGFFDGDGQISYSSTTKQSTFALYGTSKNFMNDLGDKFEQKFQVLKRVEGIIKTKMTLYTLRFSANNNRKEFFNNLFSTFYENKNYFLERKMKKFSDYLMFKYRDNLEDIERLSRIVEHRG